jgi:mRNA-degrading endonuclease RelE of RelBE toxin-antitoxin system
MDAIEKALNKFSSNERGWVKDILQKLKTGKLEGLNVKKLKGRDDIFRVRKGDIRIVYRIENKDVFVLLIERKSERTYDF